MSPSPTSNAESKIPDLAHLQNSPCAPDQSTNVLPPMQRLIPRILAQPGDVYNDDEQAWYRKKYGREIVLIGAIAVPKGWILVEGIKQLAEQN